MNYAPPYRIFPLGDTAITIDFGNLIDETINGHVLKLFHHFRSNPLPGMIEAVPAYSAITLYYDVFGISKSISNGKTVYDHVCEQVKKRLETDLAADDKLFNLVRIPVCYEKEFAPDMERMAMEKNISAEELIRIHTSKEYRVYMLGFLPGFSYMGEVDERIAMPRKHQPETVAAGSVGIAGKQTGIYPFMSPGGWQVIGRTPLKLFDAEKKEPTLLKEGDTVQFISISKDEFENY